MLTVALGVYSRPASASSGNFNSLGCQFSGTAGVAYPQSLVYGNTYRASSCGTYAMVRYDFYWSNQWYGTYYSYQWGDYTHPATISNTLGATQVYTGHQIYVSGAWQQIESLYETA
jgi:hypothetical protein